MSLAEPAAGEAAAGDPVGLVSHYLALSDERRLDEAARLLAPGVRLVWPGPPGGKVFASLEVVVADARQRYRWCKKRRDHFDVGRNEAGDVVVNSHGTLFGENLAGQPFEGVRYLDRFVVRGGLIAEQLVWNDLAESGVLAGSAR